MNFLTKSVAISFVPGEGFGGNGDGLIGRGFSTFSIEGFDYVIISLDSFSPYNFENN